jgi:hypothetical protein
MPATNRTTTKTPGPDRVPAGYRPEYAEQGRKLCLLLGATDQELAHFFEVTPEAFREWLSLVSDFAAAVRAGRELADAEVADRLYRRALGYSHDAVRVFSDRTVPYVEHYPPDTTACIFWLKSRRRDKWSDKADNEDQSVAEMLACLDAAGERAKNARRG